MVSSEFIRQMKYLSNPMVQVKVVLNGLKVSSFIFTKNVNLKKVIPDLEKRKLYVLKLYIKENGEYYESNLMDVFIVKDDADKIVFFQYSCRHKYLVRCPDFILEGYAKKKIEINETDKRFYDIHVCSVHSESASQMRIYDLRRSILIATKRNLSVVREVDRLLWKWKYRIKKVVGSDGCEVSETLDVTESESTNKIYVEIELNGKKSFSEKVSKYFSLLWN